MREGEQIVELNEPGAGAVVRFVQRLNETGQTIEITINNQRSLRVGDETSVRMLLDLIDRLEMMDELRLAGRELDEGKGLSLEQAKAQVERKYGLSL